MPISESRNFRSIPSLIFHRAKRKKNRSKMWQLRPTKDRIHLGSLFASKITSMRKEGATFIQEGYLLHPSSCFLLKPDATFFLFSYSENHLRLNAISFKCLQYIHITLCFILFHFEPIFLFFALLQTYHLPLNSELQQIERGSRSQLPCPPPHLDPSVLAIFAFFYFSYLLTATYPQQIFANGFSS